MSQTSSMIRDIKLAPQGKLKHIVQNGKSMKSRVHSVPTELDRCVANLRLDTLGIKIDKLSKEQEAYLSSWTE